MIQRISLSLVLISLLFGCAGKEFTKEEKEEIRREIIAYNSEVVAPIFFLSFAACAEYKDSGNWPQTHPSLGPSSPFSTFEAEEKGDDQSLLLRLKSSNLLWSLRSASTDKDGEKQCKSTIQASHDSNSYIFRYNSEVPFSQIDKGKWKGTTYDIFAQSTMRITAKAYPFLFIVEKYRPQPTEGEKNKFISFFNAVMLNVTVCAILDIGPNQCNMSSTQSTSDSEERKSEINNEMEKQLRKLKKKYE